MKTASTQKTTGKSKVSAGEVPSPIRSKASTKDRYIAGLEAEIEDLKDRCRAYDGSIKEMRSRLAALQVKGHSKKDLRNSYGWDGDDIHYSDTVLRFCKEWLFPRYKFLHGNWTAYDDTRRDSLSSLVLRHCPIQNGADPEDCWNRIIAPTVVKKYADMRCNINSECRQAFIGKLFGFPPTHYSQLLMKSHHPHMLSLALLPPTQDDPNKGNIDPDTLIKGLGAFYKPGKSLTTVFEFFARYVRKLHSDRYIKKNLKDNPGINFLDMIGPSDVVYIICLLKNSMHVWCPTKDGEGDEEGSHETPRPLFTRGENKKREFGKTTWSKDGMAYFKTGLAAWKNAFKRGGLGYINLVHGWEKWIENEGRDMVLGSWTRKSVFSVLVGCNEDKGAPAGRTGVLTKGEYDDGDDCTGYDTDNEVNPYYVAGRAREVNRVGQAAHAAVQELHKNNDSHIPEDDDSIDAKRGDASGEEEEEEEEEEDDDSNDDDVTVLVAKETKKLGGKTGTKRKCGNDNDDGNNMDKDGAGINNKNIYGTREDIDGEEEPTKRQKVDDEAVQNKMQKGGKKSSTNEKTILKGRKTRGGKK